MSFKRIYGIFIMLFAAGFCSAELDKSKYITIDEIKPGMDAYCLTVYKGTEIEKFDMEVLSVVKNANPGIFSSGGKNTILVMGLDERMKHTGPVQGCSGSPVYIDGRIAGALAVGFNLSKDPLYGVTPIEDMIEYTTNPNILKTYPAGNNLNIDFSRPLNLKHIAEVYQNSLKDLAKSSKQNSLTIPISCSFSTAQVDSINQLISGSGLKFYSIPAVSASIDELDVEIQPGSALVSPLVTGDISISALGTATAVEGDKVFGFGHAFLGEGSINLPMANGYVHTVVSNIASSFKLGQAGKILGSVKGDTNAGIYGKLGDEPPMIDLNITVNKNNFYKQNYKCRVAVHPRITPILVNVAVLGAAELHSSPPPHNQISYEVNIKTREHEDISFTNFTADMPISRITYDLLGMLAAILDNPFEKVDIESIDVSFNIDQAYKLTAIDKLVVSDDSPKPGDTIRLNIYTETYLKGKRKLTTHFKIPENIKPGQYRINVGGGMNYQGFLKKMSPYKFTAENIDQLFEVFKRTTAIRNDNIFVFMEIPAGGLAINNSELGNLPITKSMVLVDPKRTSRLNPYKEWIFKKISTDVIVMNDMSLTINIEE